MFEEVLRVQIPSPPPSSFLLQNTTTSDFSVMVFATGKLVNTSFRAQWNAALATSQLQVLAVNMQYWYYAVNTDICEYCH